MGSVRLVGEGSSDGPNTANVVLYPNESGADDDACTTYVAGAIDAGFGILTDNGHLGQYNTYKYAPTTYPGFDATETPYEQLAPAWIDWLTEHSEWYPSMNGCHMLVTSEYRDSGGPASLDYHRDLRVNRLADCAFNTAQAMILGVAEPEANRGKHRNFAIQEPLHTFIPETYLAEQTTLLDPEEPDEHQLGVVRSDGSATPMLTGHAGGDDWYYGEASRGRCQSDHAWDGTHTMELTECTREAVELAAANAPDVGGSTGGR
ncbi:hypothetical protein [Halobacterium zhouii]|uniref:hypothetical protein n=1 Tax=Halobacterium zhouii TaxID=2902624 RepID=UPI001E60CCC7|nr:hypothetical protein [Halobacterium zhouii]